MEIPYEVKARPDTGLWNAKLGIWLFLASEVMLFGGLFSGYVFLRLGSGADPDYHWPHGLLDVRLGFINTLVLIASSVFVVMAWVQLKLRNWVRFQCWMAAVIACALIFLVIKSFEYKAKFDHFGAKLTDKTVIEGHHLHDDVGYGEIDQITIKLDRTDLRINSIVSSEARGNLKFRVMPDNEESGAKGLINSEWIDTTKFFDVANDGKFAGKGYELTEEEAAEINDAYTSLEENLGGTFELTKRKLSQIKSAVDAHRRAQLAPLDRARKQEFLALQNQIKGGLEVTEEVEQERILLAKPIRWYPKKGIESITFQPAGDNEGEVEKFAIETNRRKLRAFGEGGGTLLDQTTFVGKLSEEKRYLVLNVDNIDLRSTPVPEDSIIWQYTDHHAKDDFIKHRAEVEAAAKEKGKEPNIADSLRIHQHKVKVMTDDGKEKEVYPEVKVPLDEVTLYSSFTPKWNTYLAVYFTLTGLHGLHVLVGALVLAYFLFFGKKLFDKDPEHMANRVEVGGLFWHFVDLVWIFLFPILYLM